MFKLIAKCGIDCSACPWGPYPRKGMTTEEFEQHRNTVKKILGYMPIHTPCLTCQIPDANIPKESKLPRQKCLIRQCVDETGVVNCAYCSRFPCDTVKATADVWTRENVEKKLGVLISEKEYNMCVKPFEGISRLEAIRASLKPEEIMEPANVPASERRVADFPQNLPYSKEEIASFQEVHKLLATIIQASLGLRQTDTFAQQYNLRNRRAHILRFLWILGRYGHWEKEKRAYLTVDARTYEANRGSEKTLAIWSFVKETVFEVLSKFGVSCERVTLEGIKEEDLVTGTGYLRSKGWVMRMEFKDTIGGNNTMTALQTYTRRLEEEYGKKAFHYFSNANMQILIKMT